MRSGSFLDYGKGFPQRGKPFVRVARKFRVAAKRQGGVKTPPYK